MARKEQMSKVKMPAPQMEDEMLQIDEAELEMEPMEEDEMEEMSPLADVSDEELIAEMEARGLSMEDAEMEPMEEGAEEEDEMEELG